MYTFNLQKNKDAMRQKAKCALKFINKMQNIGQQCL